MKLTVLYTTQVGPTQVVTFSMEVDGEVRVSQAGVVPGHLKDGWFFKPLSRWLKARWPLYWNVHDGG